MGALTGNELTVFLLGVAVLLGSAHLLGEVARRFGQPMVIGEMLAGILLGPTVFGWLAPDAQQWIFPHAGAAAIALDSIVVLGVALLLLVAGMEVDLSSVWRQGRVVALVATGGLVVPLAVGGFLAWLAPSAWGMPPGGAPVMFAAFFGAALAVSALPVIAKVLLDLDLFQTDFGVLVLVSATINNLGAWLIFSIVVGGQEGLAEVPTTIALTVGFTLLMLTVGRWVADRCLVWAQAHLSWPSGILGFVLVAGLLGAAITEAIGIHAIFGAFLAGIALGDSPHLREQARHVVHRFVEGILAPIFVAAIGLEVNFITSFQPGLVVRVLLVGMLVKILGAWLGARLARRGGIEAWGAGWALNARGEMGIVLGLLAWQSGVIGEPLFVALVMLAVVTTAMAGPALTHLLRRERIWSLGTLLDLRTCLTDLDTPDVNTTIAALARVAADRAGLEYERVLAAVLAREEIMGTGLGEGVAVPHARLVDLDAPVVVAGTSRGGIDFEGVDDEPVRLIFLILTPENDPAAQLQILATIGRLSHDPQLRHDIMAAQTPSELLGTLRVATALQKSTPKAQPA